MSRRNKILPWNASNMNAIRFLEEIKKKLEHTRRFTMDQSADSRLEGDIEAWLIENGYWTSDDEPAESPMPTEAFEVNFLHCLIRCCWDECGDDAPGGSERWTSTAISVRAMARQESARIGVDLDTDPLKRIA